MRKGSALNCTLSIILPVHNAEQSLHSRVAELLELLPEMSDRFEILIVDDGSTDHTGDVACELMRQFPQVRVLHHRMRTGIARSTQLGLEQAQGDIVFVHDERTPFRESDLRSLWAMRHDEQLVMARADQQPRPIRPALMRQLMAWGAAIEQLSAQQGEFGGMQMIRRRAIDELRQQPRAQDQLTPSMTRTDAAPNADHGLDFLAQLRELAVGE